MISQHDNPSRQKFRRSSFPFQNKAFVECSVENQTGMTLHLEDASVICSPGVRGVRLLNPNEKMYIIFGILYFPLSSSSIFLNC